MRPFFCSKSVSFKLTYNMYKNLNCRVKSNIKAKDAMTGKSATNSQQSKLHSKPSAVNKQQTDDGNQPFQNISTSAFSGSFGGSMKIRDILT